MSKASLTKLGSSILNFCKAHQIVIQSGAWLIILVSFAYVSQIKSVLLPDSSVDHCEVFIREYQLMLSSPLNVFVHIGMLVMILFDRFEKGRVVSQGDFQSWFLSVASSILLISAYFTAEMSKQHSHFLEGINWLHCVTNIKFWCFCLTLFLFGVSR